jgi:hypothetical protein
MCNLKCKIIPVRTGATGTVTKRVRKILEAIPGKQSTDSLQKTDITWNIIYNMKSISLKLEA